MADKNTFATIDDIAGLSKTVDLSGYATKSDLVNYALKYELPSSQPSGGSSTAVKSFTKQINGVDFYVVRNGDLVTINATGRATTSITNFDTLIPTGYKPIKAATFSVITTSLVGLVINSAGGTYLTPTIQAGQLVRFSGSYTTGDKMPS